MREPDPAQGYEQSIRAYIRACNEADAASIASCFVVDAVHYHPSVAKWEGAATIGDNMVNLVRERGLCWTVDQLVVDAGRSAAAIEWTGTDRVGRALRGVDWFIFEPGRLGLRKSAFTWPRDQTPTGHVRS